MYLNSFDGVYNCAAMFSLILFEPEIPPNTGNIIRLCANTGTRLHLVKPLGFEMDERRLRRAGLDYREFADVAVHDGLEDCLDVLRPRKLYACSTRGKTNYSTPLEFLDSLPAEQCLRIPMRENIRSLNLSNAAAVVVYEAWRQQKYAGGV
jgi:tRNA (cytidine/uridine-2'-O-)-methyltransferase